MRLHLFIPCFVDQLFPQTGMSMARVLQNLGCEVHYNPKQTCCGQPAFNAGYWKEAATLGGKFAKDFPDDGDYIVAPSGSCTGFVRNYYERLGAAHPGTISGHDCTRITRKAYEFTEFVTEVLGVETIPATFHGRAVYHDACGALRECGIKAAPRTLLAGVEGLELLEMPEAETCCGFGGTFAVKMEPISIGMAQTKVQSALNAGAEYILSTDVSCLMHLQGYIDKHALPLRCLHVADVLAGNTGVAE